MDGSRIHVTAFLVEVLWKSYLMPTYLESMKSLL